VHVLAFRQACSRRLRPNNGSMVAPKSYDALVTSASLSSDHLGDPIQCTQMIISSGSSVLLAGRDPSSPAATNVANYAAEVAACSQIGLSLVD
jgi:hypothetical protein